jgi:hypothetical protein
MLDGRREQCDANVWEEIRKGYKPTNVFINIPYEPAFYPLAAAIVGTIIEVGLNPQMASFRSDGKHRLCKICEFIQISKYCLTDLSYQDLHNMPFELGFFCALGRQVHTFVLIDQKEIKLPKRKQPGILWRFVRGTPPVRKFEAQISNLKGVVEVIVHENDPDKLVIELLRRMTGAVPEAWIEKTKTRAVIMEEIKKRAAILEKAFRQRTVDEVVNAMLMVREIIEQR